SRPRGTSRRRRRWRGSRCRWVPRRRFRWVFWRTTSRPDWTEHRTHERPGLFPGAFALGSVPRHLSPMPQHSGRTGGRAFPTTRRSVVEATRDENADVRRAAFEVLVSAYWRSVYSHLRMKWRAQPADAEDLAQDFFARAMARGFFDAYDPERARVRPFLRTRPDPFPTNARRDERR